MESVTKPITDTMNGLWISHEEFRGRADVLGGAVDVIHFAGHDGAPETEQEIKEEIAYYRGFCDAAITVLELRAKVEK